MTPRARTNQLLYQAELLLNVTAGEDEHAQARRMAAEEGALATLELALESLIRELTELSEAAAGHDWRALLLTREVPLAELERLRGLAESEDSWLRRLLARLDMLHSSDGVARRSSGAGQGLIAVGGADLSSELYDCLLDAKQEIGALRLTSEEW